MRLHPKRSSIRSSGRRMLAISLPRNPSSTASWIMSFVSGSAFSSPLYTLVLFAGA